MFIAALTQYLYPRVTRQYPYPPLTRPVVRGYGTRAGTGTGKWMNVLYVMRELYMYVLCMYVLCMED